MEYIICHYGEIALKKGNRKFFEEQLVRNIKSALPAGSFSSVKRISGRIIIERQSAKSEEQIVERLKKVFGIANFSFAVSCEQNMTAIKQTAVELLQKQIRVSLRSQINADGRGPSVTKRKGGGVKTFCVRAGRSAKDFPLTSQQINEIVGEHVRKKLKKKVDLENPDVTVFIEIVEKYAFLYTEKIPGPGGLPVGVSGKAVVLLSGGIDSPVAVWYAMKRGVRVILAHFHAYPQTNNASIEKAKQLKKVLDEYQGISTLHLIPFADIQKEIVLNAPANLRVILYRRFMMRIAEEIARKEGASALVTGESVGQVASQTLENIGVIEQAVSFPVLRPLAGFDKEEIIRKAREIGTYDVSILPDQDCCSRFVPKHPETRADIKTVIQCEKNLKTKGLIQKATKGTSVLHWN